MLWHLLQKNKIRVISNRIPSTIANTIIAGNDNKIMIDNAAPINNPIVKENKIAKIKITITKQQHFLSLFSKPTHSCGSIIKSTSLK